MSASEKLAPDDAVLNGCYVEIYDNGVVLTGKDLALTISNCDIRAWAGEDMPKLSAGQVAVPVPPEPPREWTDGDWRDFFREGFGFDPGGEQA